MGADRVAARRLGVAHKGTDGNVIVPLVDAIETGNAADVDHHLGRQEAHFHQRHETQAAGQHLGPRVGREGVERVLDARGRQVVE